MNKILIVLVAALVQANASPIFGMINNMANAGADAMKGVAGNIPGVGSMIVDGIDTGMANHKKATEALEGAISGSGAMDQMSQWQEQMKSIADSQDLNDQMSEIQQRIDNIADSQGLSFDPSLGDMTDQMSQLQERINKLVGSQDMSSMFNTPSSTLSAISGMSDRLSESASSITGNFPAPLRDIVDSAMTMGKEQEKAIIKQMGDTMNTIEGLSDTNQMMGFIRELIASLKKLIADTRQQVSGNIA